MKVHSLVVFENDTYTEISKALDISMHNSLRSPETHHFVEDNFITFFYPAYLGDGIVEEYVQTHRLHLIEGEDISDKEVENPNEKPLSIENWARVQRPYGYRMYRIHYWTEQPIHWRINPETDLFLYNNDLMDTLALCN
jgi:hypothetical protein